MTAPAPRPYRPPTTAPTQLVAGAVYLHVPVAWYTPNINALTMLATGLVQLSGDFNQAYLQAPERLRVSGIPVALRGKPRPVVVLRVCRLEQDTTHVEDVWVVPRYTQHERPRSGRNLFPLPRDAAYGMDEPGYLDFLQLASMPGRLLQQYGRRICDLTPASFDALVTALQGFLNPW
jgi:hypothetical protein